MDFLRRWMAAGKQGFRQALGFNSIFNLPWNQFWWSTIPIYNPSLLPAMLFDQTAAVSGQAHPSPSQHIPHHAAWGRVQWQRRYLPPHLEFPLFQSLFFFSRRANYIIPMFRLTAIRAPPNAPEQDFSPSKVALGGRHNGMAYTTAQCLFSFVCRALCSSLLLSPWEFVPRNYRAVWAIAASRCSQLFIFSIFRLPGSEKEIIPHLAHP